MPGEGQHQRVGAVQPPERFARCVHRGHAALEQQVEELGYGFRVRLGLELLALVLQFGPQLRVVFDDSVVHHRDAPGAVGVGVAFRGRAVGGPARVAYARRARQRCGVQGVRQVVELAGCAAPLDVAVDQRGNARAVIAAILQAPQGIQENGSRRALPDHADDAAHANDPLSHVAGSCAPGLPSPPAAPGRTPCHPPARPPSPRCPPSSSRHPPPQRAPPASNWSR